MRRSEFILNKSRIVAVAALVCPLLAGPTLAAEINCTWIAGDGNWSNAAKWGCGVVPNNGADSFNVFIDDDSNVDSLLTLNVSVVINRLDVAAGDRLAFNNSQDLTLGIGPIINNGLISMNASNSDTDLRLGSSMLFTGSGAIEMSNSGNNQIRNNFGGTPQITNDVDHTIRGAGQFGLNGLHLINDGLIDATGTTNALQVDLNDNIANNLNTGTMQASGGGFLNIINTPLDNTSGLIQALDASTVSLIASTIKGGELHTEGSGVIRASTSPPFIDNITLTGLLRHANSEDAQYSGTIINDGKISLEASNSDTDIRVHADTTFGGTGAIEMSNSSNNQIRNNFGGFPQLTQGVDHTIRGAGQIGLNTLHLINNGLIDATSGTNALQFDLSDDITKNLNKGTMQASGGGFLNIVNSPINNTGGLIQALDGSTVNLIGTATTITGGELHTEGSGVIRASTSPPFIDNLELTGLLRHANSEDAQYNGTITNNGTISLEGTNSDTDIRVHSDGTTFAGTGMIEMSNSTVNQIRNNFGGITQMINAATHTIRGAGQIGVNTLNLINEGLIDATQEQVLQIDLNDTIARNINKGTLQASAGGTLNVFNTPLDNNEGMIQAFADSTVNLIGSTIVGGELHTEDNGAIFASTSPPFLQDVTLTGLLRCTNSQDAQYNGTITNNGTISLEASNSDTDIRVHSDGTTFAGTGMIEMSNSTVNQIRNNFGGITQMINAATHTIRGSGQIGVNTMNLINEGLIDANQAQVLQIDLNDTIARNINKGTLQASAGGTLNILNTPLDNSEGLIQAGAGSTVNLIGSMIVGGQLHTEDDGAIFGSTSSPFLQNVTLTGLLRCTNSQDAQFDGTITNNGTISLEATSSDTDVRVNSDGTTFTGTGEIVMSNSGNNLIRNNFSGVRTLTNGTTHTIRGTGQIGVNTLFVINDGEIVSDLSAGISIDCSDAEPGFTNNGTLSALGAGGVTIQPGAVNNNGVFLIAPGSQIFRNAAFTQPDTGTIHVQMAGTNTGDAGQFKVSQTLSRNGIVNAEAVNGYVPEVADEVLVFTVGAFNGDFDLFTTTNFPGGLTIRPLYVGNQGFIVVVRLGDMNCDGAVDFDDIDGFVMALISPAEYKAAFPDCTIANGDINGDGSVDFDDIDAFVACLIAGGCS